MGLGAKLKAARQARGLSLAELADSSGLTKGFISQVENGRSNPSLDSLRRIAVALEVSVQSLLDDSNLALYSSGTHRISTQIFRLKDYSTADSSLKGLFDSKAAAFVLVQLAPGDALLHKGSPGRLDAALGVIVVLEGEAHFSLDADERDLSADEMLTWDAGKPYRVENAGAAQLRLLLSLEHGLDTPALVHSTPDYYGVLRQTTSQTPADDGPLRLVAMRQQMRSRAAGSKESS